jgi:choline dehydrogenase
MNRPYDYIIVGAGSAGCVLAHRLTEQADVSVLLIEAGVTPRHPYLKVPLAWLRAAGLNRHLWWYQTEPEPGLGGRSLKFHRGRVLGGTSSINGMIYARGHPRDYDQWAARGASGWSYADVLPYFKRLETSWRGAGPVHGDTGPIHITQTRLPAMHYEDLESAVIAAGYGATDDLNAAPFEGVSRMELTVRDGIRESTARAYLAPALWRPNLTVRSGAQLQRVLIEHGRAVGVQYRQGSQQHTVRAHREIVLSGGTYGSPQMLMLSGIGSARELEELGITPRVDLPGVGQNLIDHVLAPVLFKSAHADTFLQHLRFDRAALATLQWLLLRTGPMATNGVGANIYLRSDSELQQPDIRLICGTIGLDAKVWTPGASAPPHRFSCTVNLLHPESRGSVQLSSASPDAAPRIQFNVLSTDADVATLIKGIRLAREIYAKQPLARHVEQELMPGPDAQSDAELIAYLRRIAIIGQHPVGTCAMGIDANAVVDPELRVQGVDALRVVDASVMPDQIGGNPNVPVIMIAEKAADLMQQVGG